ncbi:hypothetical protein SLE2022_056160 [Rubroshorea leprosula]
MENNLAERSLPATKEQENTTNLRTKVLNESKTIWRITFHGIMAKVTAFGLIIVTQSFLDHVSDIQLATFVFVQSIFLRFINGILISMSSAVETLCGQAYGPGQYHMMGIYLQRLKIAEWFSKAAFQDILPVIKLSLSSGIMLCLELWYNSILVLLAGYMKNATVAISALSICLNISPWEFMICLGFFAAACVRVANELGKGNAEAVKFSIKSILSTTTFIGMFFFVLCLVFGRQISYLFSSSEEVAESVSSLSNLLAINILFNSIQPVLSGVAIGAGMQTTVAVVNLECYHVIGYL